MCGEIRKRELRVSRKPLDFSCHLIVTVEIGRVKRRVKLREKVSASSYEVQKIVEGRN